MLHDFQREKYKTAMEFLERRGCYVAAAVLSLGEPHLTGDDGTAYVALLDRHLVFGFSRDWFDGLTADELAAVLLHETMHVVHRHIFYQPLLSHPFERYLYNLACDAVINDLILHHYSRMTLPDEPITGMTLLGKSTVGMTAEEVLRELCSQQPPLAVNLHTLDDHSLWEAAGEADPARQQQIEELLGQLTARIEKSAQLDSWGREAVGKLRGSVENASPVRLEPWLVRMLGSKLKLETTWTPPSRRLMTFYPDLVLPSHTTSELRRVLLAVDASGSMSDAVIGACAAVTQRRMDACSIVAISFDTQAYPFDPQQIHQGVRGGGGTSFQCIENYALSLAHYPDVIVVFTDGQAPRPRVSHPERWIWCLTETHSSQRLHGIGTQIMLPL